MWAIHKISAVTGPRNTRWASQALLAASIGLGLTCAGCGGDNGPPQGTGGPLPATTANDAAAAAPPPPVAPAPAAHTAPSDTVPVDAPHTTGPGMPDHLSAALEFAEDIGPYGTTYVRGGNRVIWPQIKGGPMCRTDCSGFLNAVLTHSMGYTTADFKPWFGTERPLARDWYAAIAAERGFDKTTAVARLQPGSFLVIQFPPGGEVTGHCMLVAGQAVKREATAPLIDGTTQWAVSVVDASKTPHGDTDTRYRALKPLPPADPNRIEQRDTMIEPVQGPPPGADPVDASGLGRGTLRIYADQNGNIAGYTWSVAPESKFKSASEYRIIAGNWMSGFDPNKAPAGEAKIDPAAGD